MPRQRPEQGRSRRWRLVSFGGVALVALLAAGWLFATLFQSPEQFEASAEPDPPGPVTAAVTQEDLVETRTFRGTIKAGSTSVLMLPESAAGDRSVITRNTAKLGDSLNSTAIVAEVNGRPVFLVASKFPFYRDIGPGDSGPDVRNVQQALVDAGLLGAADGQFGSKTATAVARLYAKYGYSAPQRLVEISESAAQPAPNADPNTAPTPPAKEVFLPWRELLATPSLPGRVLTLPTVGASTADAGGEITLGSSELVARFIVPAAQLGGLATGDTLSITVGTDAPIEATVTSAISPTATVSPTPNPTAEDAAPGGPSSGTTEDLLVTVQPTEGSFTAEQENQIVIASLVLNLAAEDSLIVPSVAIAAREDGTAIVLKLETDGTFLEVEVTETAALRGRSAVVPRDATELVADDKVRID